MLKKLLKDYFSFNKTERRGVFVLIFIIVILIAANWAVPKLISKKQTDFALFQKEINEFEKNRIASAKNENNRHIWKDFDYAHPDKSVAVSNLTPFPFNPNLLNEEEWKQLGLTGKQIRSIMNYRAKGGTYRSKKDFKKMYCISPDEYEALAPFIRLPDSIAHPVYENNENKFLQKKEQLTVELNTATAEDLDRIKGIGKYFAEKIIKYRGSLGGFCRKEQLLELPRMDSTRYNQIAAYITLNPTAIHKLNVNTATFDELSAHPYIRYNVALSLTNYRSKHGKFSQLQDIKKSALITETLYAKISPYLKAE